MIWHSDLCWLLEVATVSEANGRSPEVSELESFVLQGNEGCLVDRRCFFRPPHL